MALRLIEMVLREEEGEGVRELLKEHKVLEHRQVQLADGEVLVRILLDAERSEEILNLLEEKYAAEEGNRILILPVEATLPRIEPEPEETATDEKSPERIAGEELYEDIKDAADFSNTYLALVVLSTVVAAIGLRQNSVAIIIGAMVIAPMLGSNMALALSTTLGDLPLLWRAFRTIMAGMVVTIALSVIIGVLLYVDPAKAEVASRTRVELSDIAVALASGCAGSLVFTSGLSAALVGVMVSVALFPPLVTCGLLLGGGKYELAIGALSLFLVNLICVNLAGVITFLVKGIQPATLWEKDRATKATRIAIVLWVTLLAALISIILFLNKG